MSSYRNFYSINFRERGAIVMAGTREEAVMKFSDVQNVAKTVRKLYDMDNENETNGRNIKSNRRCKK